MKSEEFNRNHSNNSFYFISEIDNTVVTAGVIADNKNKVELDLAEFFKYLDLTMKDVAVNEITFNGIENLLGAANRMDYIEDDDDIMAICTEDSILIAHGILFDTAFAAMVAYHSFVIVALLAKYLVFDFIAFRLVL